MTVSAALALYRAARYISGASPDNASGSAFGAQARIPAENKGSRSQ